MKQLKTLLTIALCGLCMLANSQSLPCNNEFFVKHYKLGKANYDKQNYAAALHDIDIAGQICPTCQDCKTMLADCKAKIKATKIAEVKKILPTTKKFKDLPFADMVYVEGGSFMMGDVFGENEPDETPVHNVSLNSFYMGKYEVTQRQWVEIMGTFPSYFTNCDNCPVENVSWDDVQEFLTELNVREGRNASNSYRLPTEAEWEYAARERGKKVQFGNGKDLLNASEANFDASASYKQIYSSVGEYRKKTVNVTSFKPNDLGLYNITGNVWEWCADWYASDWYIQTEATDHNPQNKSYNGNSNRVLRGGSWNDDPRNSRVAHRGDCSPSAYGGNIGFRLVYSE